MYTDVCVLELGCVARLFGSCNRYAIVCTTPGRTSSGEGCRNTRLYYIFDPSYFADMHALVRWRPCHSESAGRSLDFGRGFTVEKESLQKSGASTKLVSGSQRGSHVCMK